MLPWIMMMQLGMQPLMPLLLSCHCTLAHLISVVVHLWQLSSPSNHFMWVNVLARPSLPLSSVLLNHTTQLKVGRSHHHHVGWVVGWGGVAGWFS